MEQAREGQLTGAGPAADLILGLEHRDAHTLAGQRDPAGEPIRARADDDRLAQATGTGSFARAVPRSTSTGKSKDSSSQGWLATMSATATEPSSSSPSAASQIS